MIKVFVLKVVLFSAPLLFIPLGIFYLLDPYMLFGKNSGNFGIYGEYVIRGNRDFQSTELFLKNNSKFNYDSFIMGNSRSLFYKCSDWLRHVDGNCFHFDASAESLFGISGKVNLLSRNNVKIKNILLILDHATLAATENSSGHLFIKHPKISNESYFQFHAVMFGGYFSKFFIALMDLTITKDWKGYMGNLGINKNTMSFEPVENELTYSMIDSLLLRDENSYYADKMNIFYKRSAQQKVSGKVIFEKQRNMLGNVRDILENMGANFKIIINPLYDQKKLNREDLTTLRDIFGPENVHDFSGLNEITSNYRNYYEESHYRPHVSRQLLKTVYGEIP